ncbi:UNVERIFIED_CONTAM: hypothetical protein PYX00_009287 [Menopon gallinae]|uniref:Uncharacterized protein n=1 Tax=Menopon gallinae TaxID=328185 RepID=A0AAW2HAG9_9NEOP
MSKYFVFLVGLVACAAAAETRCEDDDGVLPDKLQAALTACQNDLESLIRHGFFHGLAEAIRAGKRGPERSKRDGSYPERQEIAGCMLLCMFRKLKMVDEDEIPTVEGLIKHLGERVKQRGYFLAMTQAVQQCVAVGKKLAVPKDNTSHKCVVSYKIFDCIRGQMAEYCQGQ